MEDRVKFPSIPYLSTSPSISDEDDVVELSIFEDHIIVVTEKMDGENTTMYRDGIHARSIDSGYHPSRTWVQNFHAQIAHKIPRGWRICGENLYAVHSIQYENLPSYFMGFAVWDGKNCLSWRDTVETFDSLGIVSVPVLFKGYYEDWTPMPLSENQEGYVVRVVYEMNEDNFGESIAKFVRANHVQTGSHWMHGAVKQNGLAK